MPDRAGMNAPRRNLRSYITEKLPTGADALDEPFAAFPSWYLRVECDRCEAGVQDRAARIIPLTR